MERENLDERAEAEILRQGSQGRDGDPGVGEGRLGIKVRSAVLAVQIRRLIAFG